MQVKTLALALASFSKAPEKFLACKAIFRSSVPKNSEGHRYMPETACENRISGHFKNTVCE